MAVRSATKAWCPPGLNNATLSPRGPALDSEKLRAPMKHMSRSASTAACSMRTRGRSLCSLMLQSSLSLLPAGYPQCTSAQSVILKRSQLRAAPSTPTDRQMPATPSHQIPLMCAGALARLSALSLLLAFCLSALPGGREGSSRNQRLHEYGHVDRWLSSTKQLVFISRTEK